MYTATFLSKNPMYPTVRHMARTVEVKVESKAHAQALVTSGKYMELVCIVKS